MNSDADAKSEARLLYEAARQAGFRADPEAVRQQIDQLQRGLPAEDEFAALCVWSGRCRLIHGLSQEQFPASSKEQFQVPDLFAVFDVGGQEVPVLIEVKTANDDLLKFPAAYHRRLRTYAEAVGLPLLIAWRGQFGLWTLFDIRHMQRGPGGAWRADFNEVMKQTLMGVLLGEFFIDVKAGVGMTFQIREDQWLSDTRLVGTIVAAYWHGPDGTRVEGLKGTFLPILMCCPEAVEATREGKSITQRFYTPHDNGVPAHRAMLTSLLGEGEPNWLEILRSGKLAGGRDLVRTAAEDAMSKGLVGWIGDIEPQQRPDFLPERNLTAKAQPAEEP